MASAIHESAIHASVRTTPVSAAIYAAPARNSAQSAIGQTAKPFDNDFALLSDNAMPEALGAAVSSQAGQSSQTAVQSDTLENLMPPALFMSPSMQAQLYGAETPSQDAVLYPLGLTQKANAYTTNLNNIYPTQLNPSEQVEYPLGLVQSANSAAALYDQVDRNNAIQTTGQQLIASLA